jgi:hypothetical protein
MPTSTSIVSNDKPRPSCDTSSSSFESAGRFRFASGSPSGHHRPVHWRITFCPLHLTDVGFVPAVEGTEILIDSQRDLSFVYITKCPGVCTVISIDVSYIAHTFTVGEMRQDNWIQFPVLAPSRVAIVLH